MSFSSPMLKIPFLISVIYLQKRRLDSTSSMGVPKVVVPSVVRPAIPAVVRLPACATSSTSAKVRAGPPVTPSASSILSHAHMRKQSMMPTEAKYEDYSDVSQTP